MVQRVWYDSTIEESNKFSSFFFLLQLHKSRKNVYFLSYNFYFEWKGQ